MENGHTFWKLSKAIDEQLDDICFHLSTIYTLHKFHTELKQTNFDTFWVWDAISSLLIPVGHYKTQISWEAIHLDAKGTQLGLAAWWNIDNKMVEYHPPPKITIYSKGGSIIQYDSHIQVFKQVTWQLSGPGLCWLYH